MELGVSPPELEGNTQCRQAVDPGSWSDKEGAPFSMEGSPGGLEGQAHQLGQALRALHSGP